MRKPSVSPAIRKLISRHSLGIKLDVGCGSNKQAGYVGLDKRKLDGVDIAHDAEVFPYPLPDGCCSTILMSHLIEHIKPWLTVDLLNEMWRLLKPNGQLLISTPYAGSFGYWQDPTHCNGCNEATWTYFDPDYFLHCIYRPKPWKIERNAWWETGNMEVILAKRPLDYKSTSTPLNLVPVSGEKPKMKVLKRRSRWSKEAD